MKQSSIATAFLAVGATAQNYSTSTTTQYYNTCSVTAAGIVTATDVMTYCPPCEAAGMSSFPGGSLTTYTTSYSRVCPTGLEEATYTVTEPCPSTGLARDSSYMPQGFTVSTVPCSICEAGKSQYAQTTPGPALASALATPAAAPAVPTPAAQAGKAVPPAAAPAENGAAAPAENGAAAPAESPAGAPAPYPLPSQAGQVAAASGAPASNGNSTVPFKGAANLVSAVGISSFITALATLITGFAFVL
ncbi:MAG: hypothetical protein ASARMPRED_008983 [Alectoria sarmentosa]|nr:MAG: hypothetical protein ASARMPRED_008983 [Alectoria sarmentosa]